MSEGLQQMETHEDKIRREYSEVVAQYRNLQSVDVEAGEILFGGRRAANDDERAIGQVTLVREAMQSEAEGRADRGQRYGERASRMLEQMKQAQINILSLYCDALHESDALAELIAEENPWVVSAMRASKASNEDEYIVEKVA